MPPKAKTPTKAAGHAIFPGAADTDTLDKTPASLQTVQLADLAARLEGSEERVIFLEATAKRLSVRLAAMAKENEEAVTSLRTAQETNKKLLAKLEEGLGKFKVEVEKLTGVSKTVDELKAVKPRPYKPPPPTLSYRSSGAGDKKSRFVLGTKTGSTAYVLTGCNKEANAVFSVTATSDGRHVLSLESEEFPAYEEFCPAHVSLAQMLYICYPKGDFKFSDMTIE